MFVLIGNTPYLLWWTDWHVIHCDCTCCSESHTPDCPLWPQRRS